MNVSRFQLLKRSSAAALAEAAEGALAQWSARWCALPDHAVVCVAASDQQALGVDAELRRRTLDSGEAVWVMLPNGIERLLEQLMFGLHDMDATSDKHLASRLGTDVAADALEDLLQCLVHALAGKASQAAPALAPAPLLYRRGSGAVVCTVALGERALRLLLAPQVLPQPALRKKRTESAPLVPLHQALARLPIHLSVEVCSTELTLGYLRTLAVGDVLALPMAIDQELRVIGPGGSTVCHAHLGAMSGSYAVELMKKEQA